MSVRNTALVAGLCFGAAISWSQEDTTVRIARLADHIYKLTADRGTYVVNVVASVGDDGVLLVDTGEWERAEDLRKAVDSFGLGDPRIIINTHAHVDHTGGNAICGSSAVIVGHDILRSRLRSGSYLFDEFPSEALPTITFREAMSVHFNGERIDLMAMGGSHDDNDAIVWFTESGVVCLGDIANGTFFPSVEEVTGNVLNFPAVIQKVIAAVPNDVVFVSGHGADCQKDDLLRFSQMVSATARIVQQGIEAGKGLADLINEDALHGWEDWEGSYVSKKEWIVSLHDALSGADLRKPLYEPMYHALADAGPDAAIAEYSRLKRNHPDDYRFVENDLAVMADKLFRHQRYPEAIALLNLCVSEYPDGMYAYYYHYLIGRAQISLGKRESAIENFKRALALNPGLTRAQEFLASLEREEASSLDDSTGQRSVPVRD